MLLEIRNLGKLLLHGGLRRRFSKVWEFSENPGDLADVYFKIIIILKVRLSISGSAKQIPVHDLSLPLPCDSVSHAL